MNPVLDIHMHTVASGHAYSTVGEYARAAAEKGLELIGIADHAPAMPGSAGALYFDNLRALPRVLNGVEILRGVELNILDESGAVDLKPKVLEKLDFAIASLHTPCLKDGLGDYTRTLINTVKNPYVKIIGHVCDPRYPFDMEAVIRAAKENGVYPEINNSSLKPGSHRAGGEALLCEFIGLCIKLDCPMVMGSDAHFHTDAGNFGYVMKLLAECGAPERLVLNASVRKFKEAMGI